ncbi:hypothetical protein JXA48_03300 [Candidatus Woesearchaeota archaeon]|nr:hypothetical protein [Candidatus Woesearchaeota archaeon]
MVRISIDTEKDSPEMIAKLIDVLNAHLGQSSSTQVPVSSSAPIQSSSSPFDIFGSMDSVSNSSSSSLPSSAPIQSTSSSSIFDVFADEPKQNQLSSSSSYGGVADDNLFGAFSNDLPSTDFRSSTPSLQSTGLEASFASAQTLLDDNFNPIQDEEDDDEPEEKSANFFNFEQY